MDQSNNTSSTFIADASSEEGIETIYQNLWLKEKNRFLISKINHMTAQALDEEEADELYNLYVKMKPLIPSSPKPFFNYFAKEEISKHIQNTIDKAVLAEQMTYSFVFCFLYKLPKCLMNFYEGFEKEKYHFCKDFSEAAHKLILDIESHKEKAELWCLKKEAQIMLAKGSIYASLCSEGFRENNDEATSIDPAYRVKSLKL